MRARLYAARFVSAANPGAEVPPTPPLSYFAAVDLQVNRAAARDLYPVPACGCGVLLALRRPPARPRTADPASASGRCADSVYNFPVHAPNRTQHAPSISYRCRSRRSICRIGTRARTLQFTEQAIRSTGGARCPAPYAVVRVVSQMISMEPTRLRIAWLTSRFLRDAP